MIETDSGLVRELPAQYVAEHVEHAYALTGHGMQGATVEAAIVVASPRDLTAGWSYTALSRARGQTRLLDPRRPADARARRDRARTSRTDQGAAATSCSRGRAADARARRRRPRHRTTPPRRQVGGPRRARRPRRDPGRLTRDTSSRASSSPRANGSSPPWASARRSHTSAKLEKAVRAVTSYRARYDITDPRDPLGPRPEQREQRRDWQSAQRAIERAQRRLHRAPAHQIDLGIGF